MSLVTSPTDSNKQRQQLPAKGEGPQSPTSKQLSPSSSSGGGGVEGPASPNMDLKSPIPHHHKKKVDEPATTTPSPSAGSSPRDGFVMKAQHSYVPREKHQLAIQADERILVLEKDTSGWWIGRDQRGAVGLVPRTFVEGDKVEYPPQDLLWKLAATKEAIRLELERGRGLVSILGRCIGHPVLTSDNLIPVVNQFREMRFSRTNTPHSADTASSRKMALSSSNSGDIQEIVAGEDTATISPDHINLVKPSAAHLGAAADEIIQTVPRSVALDIRRSRSSHRSSLAEQNVQDALTFSAGAPVDDLYELPTLALYDEFESLTRKQSQVAASIAATLERVAFYRLNLRESEGVDSVMETLVSAKGHEAAGQDGGGGSSSSPSSPSGPSSSPAYSNFVRSREQSRSGGGGAHRGIMRMSMAESALALASNILSEDNTPHGKITAELQRKQILADKLASVEKNISDAEIRENMLLDRLERRKIEVPESIVAYQQELSKRTCEAKRKEDGLLSPRGDNDEGPGKKEEEDEGWLKNVELPQCRAYLIYLQKKFLNLNDEIDDLELELETKVSQFRQMQKQIKNGEAAVEQQDEQDEQELEEYLTSIQSEVEKAKAQYTKTKADASSDGGVSRAVAEVAEFKKKIEKEVAEHASLEEQIESWNAKLTEMRDLAASSAKVDAIRGEITQLKAREEEAENDYKVFADSLGERLAAKRTAYRALERQRRETYNAIQDIRGNIRVYCRIKPLSSHEKDECLTIVDDMTLQVSDVDTGRVTKHEFDLVIGKDASQQEIFEEARPLATSVLDGYNVCIFAYGQTGSGKTYTMEGPPNNRGINYRTVQELFNIAHNERKEDYTYTLAVSILEVYNDKAYDLMTASRHQSKVRWAGGSGAQQHVGDVVVEPLTKKTVHSADEVQAVLDAAYKNRSVAGTDSNAHSSRSHSVLTVYVTAVNSATNTSLKAKLHLIDLAGSERVKASGVEGDRLKEATHINSSLSHLKTVIQGLANKKAFIGYRNSTLTSLLQDSLGGNCKTLMFANISAHTQNIPESLCTIKYAAEARKVEVGKVSANTASR